MKIDMNSVQQPNPILVSVDTAATMLGMSRPTVYKLLNSGALHAVKSGGRTLIPTQALRDYAETLSSYVPAAQNGRKVKRVAPALAAPVADRMLRIEAVMARTGLGKSSIYGQSAAGKFPRQIPLGGRASGWRESDVDAWIADPSGYTAKP
ncbi:AlpA family phage regulatory protein [Sphingomonas sp. RHCKR47]|uniref:AlpA family phage regulatory protein n=1 Tax=Sphingomonas citricola TaxID=2862498 RepID=UPI001CA5D108|nr:AlpA family phage regulatory protein [Sphingomonas citricola]MBW6523282.1 AlpA family phage regulatory protein [Sphingomonas citricola]